MRPNYAAAKPRLRTHRQRMAIVRFSRPMARCTALLRAGSPELARNRHRHVRLRSVSSSARAEGRHPALGWGNGVGLVGQAMTVPLIERFRDRLPVSDATPVVSLGEGSTPLLRAPRLGERLGVELWLKWEASNPTASYKDRGMTVAVSKAVEDGARAVVCASTGNTSASAAAYAARAGLQAIVLVADCL